LIPCYAPLECFECLLSQNSATKADVLPSLASLQYECGYKIEGDIAMDLNYSTDEEAFRKEVRTWLDANIPADLRQKVLRYEELGKEGLLTWHKILAKKGWIAPSWPAEWGGTDWSVVQRYIFEEEMAVAGAPPLIPFGLTMCAQVLLKFGSPEQKKRFLPRIYDGEDF
jgi:alkylation response protein AidB-like acyl-CoA dehydrogenase